MLASATRAVLAAADRLSGRGAPAADVPPVSGCPGGEMVMTAIAHELRTPLTTIRSLSEILQDNPDLPPEQREQFLRALNEETMRMHRAIESLLAASSANPQRWCVEAAGFPTPPAAAERA